MNHRRRHLDAGSETIHQKSAGKHLKLWHQTARFNFVFIRDVKRYRELPLEIIDHALELRKVLATDDQSGSSEHFVLKLVVSEKRQRRRFEKCGRTLERASGLA